MKISELQDLLDTAHIERADDAKKADLIALYEQGVADGRIKTDEELQNIADEVSGKNVPTVDEMIEKNSLTRIDGDALTPSGVIVPASVLAHLPPSRYHYMAKSGGDKAVVFKVDQRGKVSVLREYSQSRHGNDFKELAEGLAEKKNRLGS